MRRWLAALAFALAACSGGDGGAGEEAKFQKALAQAREEARAHLPLYWEHFEAPLIDEYNFTLKVALPATDGTTAKEEVWVENIARAPDSIAGELMTDPEHLGALKRGAIVRFSEGDIVDWAFLRGPELIGHYTTRVLLPRMPPEQADGLRSMLGENPQ